MALTYIASVTASASATIDFTTGIDSTYNEYQFHFVNMHPSNNQQDLVFQVNNVTDGADFNDSLITSTFFDAFHNEAGSDTALTYVSTRDLANAANFQPLFDKVTNAAADASVSGVLTLYNPSSTTYVKHFTSRVQGMHHSTYSGDCFAAGYINDTKAIDEIRFKFASGNIDAGTIHMYGVG
jgi:hypothetical protein